MQTSIHTKNGVNEAFPSSRTVDRSRFPYLVGQMDYVRERPEAVLDPIIT